MFVYLDNSATTRQYDQVTLEMLRLITEDFGNPSSLHRMGISAELKIKEARAAIAFSLNAKEEEIYFTGSGTEADNMAIFGAYNAKKRRGNRVITSKAEHPAVMEACKRLEMNGVQVVYLDIDSKGLVDMDQLESSLDESTIMVTIMAVNNELGTVAPIEEIGALVKSKGDILFHTDAVQAYGKIPIEPDKWKADLITLSGHKIHGPKGTGAIYIKKGIHIEPYIYGGGQEMGMRSGTENTPGVVGFGLAADIMHANLYQRIQTMEKVKSYLLSGIIAEISDIRINSPETISSPGILNVSFLGCRGEVLLHSLEQEDIYVSTGAACSSKKKGSRVLSAAGLSDPVIDSAIRFSFSEHNTVEQMDYVLAELKKAVTSMRRLTKHRH